MTRVAPPIILVGVVGGAWMVHTDQVPRTVEASHGRGVARRRQIWGVDEFPAIRREVRR